MISVSSIPVTTSFNNEDFNLYFKNLENVATLLECKPVRHLKKNDNKISFILKRVAQFEFVLSKQEDESWVQFDSTSTTTFKSAIRFELKNSEIQIHFETDTNVFMELFLENRISKLLEYISHNLSKI